MVTIKQVGSIVWRFAKKLPSFSSKKSSLMKVEDDVNLSKKLQYRNTDFLYQYLNFYHNFFVTHFPSSVKLAVILLQQKMVKLAVILLQQKMVKLAVNLLQQKTVKLAVNLLQQKMVKLAVNLLQQKMVKLAVNLLQQKTVKLAVNLLQ